MRWYPKGYGGRRRDPEQVKREGWREQGVLAVSADDDRLTWPERELVRQLGERLYGKRPETNGGAPWLTGPRHACRTGWNSPRTCSGRCPG
jgi:hypothetical protein